MMKKLAALSLALMLVLSLTLASAETYQAGEYYKIDIPDTTALDDVSYVAENTPEYSWLFMLVSDQWLIDATFSLAEGYEGASLYNASSDDVDAYVDDTLDAYADRQITLVDTLSLDNGIPFFIYSMDDGDGAYYYAETIIDGRSFNFSAYYNDAELPLDTALLNNLQQVLKTFEPVTQAAPAADTSNEVVVQP